MRRRHERTRLECLACGYPFDRQEDLIGDGRRPRDGDPSLCLNCGALARFESPDAIRPATDSDLFGWMVSDPEQWGLVEAAREFIRRRGRTWPEAERRSTP